MDENSVNIYLKNISFILNGKYSIILATMCQSYAATSLKYLSYESLKCEKCEECCFLGI